MSGGAPLPGCKPGHRASAGHSPTVGRLFGLVGMPLAAVALNGPARVGTRTGATAGGARIGTAGGEGGVTMTIDPGAGTIETVTRTKAGETIDTVTYTKSGATVVYVTYPGSGHGSRTTEIILTPGPGPAGHRGGGSRTGTTTVG